MRAPKDKHESIDLFVRGRYGNNVPTWPSPIEALEKSSVSKFVIRYKGEPGVQGPALFGIPADNLIKEWAKLAEKWDEKRLYVNDAVDPDRIVLQGELLLSHDDGWLFRGRARPGIHMREAMKEARTWKGGKRANCCAPRWTRRAGKI